MQYEVDFLPVGDESDSGDAIALRFGKRTTTATKYSSLAQTYRAHVRKGAGDPAIHFDRLAEQARESASHARAEATKHTQLAQVG